jgi:hypothetical protein
MSEKLSWTMRDDSTLVATGNAGVGYVITADHGAEDEPSYTLHLPAGAYSSPTLIRLMLDAEAIEEHHAKKVAA